jgi:hypothetical protein
VWTGTVCVTPIIAGHSNLTFVHATFVNRGQNVVHGTMTAMMIDVDRCCTRDMYNRMESSFDKAWDLDCNIGTVASLGDGCNYLDANRHCVVN